jgi:phage gpG-like protein
MLNFEVNYTGAKKVEEALRGLNESLSSAQIRRLLNKLGNIYLADTLKRFENQHDPDRKPWKELRPVTIKLKTNGMSGRGPSIDAPTRKGVWTGDLISSLTFRVEGNSVFVGSDVEHAPYFHYGVKKSKSLSGNRKTPWGQVPARRFLGRNTRIDAKVLKAFGDEICNLIGINPNSVKSAV